MPEDAVPEAIALEDDDDEEAAGAEDAALDAADEAALDEAAVLLEELQADSTSAAVATPAISDKFRARSTCSPFPSTARPRLRTRLSFKRRQRRAQYRTDGTSSPVQQR